MSNENKQNDERAAFVKAVQSLAFLCRTETKRLDHETLAALDNVENQLVAMGLSARDGDGDLRATTPSAVAGSAGQAALMDEQIDAVVIAATKHISDNLVRMQTDKEIRALLAAPVAALTTDAGAVLDERTARYGRALIEDIDWCIEEGNCGPRTRRTLQNVKDLLIELYMCDTEQRMSDAAPTFEGKHVSLKQHGAKLVLTLELDAIEEAPRYTVTPLNPAAVRDAAHDPKDRTIAFLRDQNRRIIETSDRVHAESDRYRWLRRQAVATHHRDELICQWEVDYVLRGESFDEAIDAARKAEIERMGDAEEAAGLIGPAMVEHEFSVSPSSGIEICLHCGISKVAARTNTICDEASIDAARKAEIERSGSTGGEA